jgi:hypothetical protein
MPPSSVPAALGRSRGANRSMHRSRAISYPISQASQEDDQEDDNDTSDNSLDIDGINSDNLTSLAPTNLTTTQLGRQRLEQSADTYGTALELFQRASIRRIHSQSR